jgi:predicted dehydrogenase
MRSFRVGVVGLGTISKFYLAAIPRVLGAAPVAVCDVREERLARHRGLLPCYRDHRELLAAESLDGVVVTVPNDAHARVCRDVIESGLPVCVEKPLARTLPEGRLLAKLATAGGVPLFTAFHRRYNESVLALATRVRGKAPVARMTVRYFERIEDHIGQDTWYLDPARCGGGCVADNGPNAFDLVRLFLGDVEVSGASVRRDQRGIDRQATVDLRGRTATARVELDWSFPGEVKDIELWLADGTRLRADMLHGHPGFKGSLWHEYVGVVTDFARLAGDGDAGVAALELVDATYRAVSE